MKKVVIIFISIFCIMAAGLTALLVVVINRGGNINVYGESKLQLVNTLTLGMKEIDSIRIKYYYDDVVFYKSNSDELVVKEFKNFTPEKSNLARSNNNGNKVTIMGDDNTASWFTRRDGRAEIYLPKEYSGKLDISTTSGNISSDLLLKAPAFQISSNSGDIALNKVYAKNINASTSSGNITFNRAEGKRDISSTSGDIEVYNGSGDSSFSTSSGYITIENSDGVLDATANSGDIEIHHSKGDKELKTSSGYITLDDSDGFVKATASSGDISVTGARGGAEIKTSSGYINLELTKLTDNIKLTASSGDVELRLPTATAFQFTASASSGDIETSFDDSLSYNKKGNHATGMVGENPITSINIQTTSGYINVTN